MLDTTKSAARSSTTDRLTATPRPGWTPWLWLAAGAMLMQFAQFGHVIALAAWLAPVFLLRFVRTQRAVVALPVIGLLGYLTTLIALREVISAPGSYLFALAGLITIVPYGTDRLLARRIGGLLGTLVFPAADTTIPFLLTFAGRNAFASFGSAAYTQGNELPLVQLVSVTGIWGLGFLMAWLAPVANDLWERGFDPRPVWRATATFAAVLVAVLLFGGARLASPPTAPTVKVAALAPDRVLSDAIEAAPLGPRPLPVAARAKARQRYLDPLADDLFARTRQAAHNGAKIVAWSEAAAFVFKEDEPAFVDRARAVAREEHIYLQIGLIPLLPSDRYPYIEDRALMLDPAGATIWDYPKATETLTDGNRPGPGIVPTADTPYGRLATVICLDADFPDLVRQAGRARADILLEPSSDWAAVAEPHGRMAVFRAVENGLALVRPTRQGTSLASDHQGRLLGYKSDYFAGTDQTMIVNVPTHGTRTLYPYIGDVAGWVSVLGLPALYIVTLARRRQRATPA